MPHGEALLVFFVKIECLHSPSRKKNFILKSGDGGGGGAEPASRREEGNLNPWHRPPSLPWPKPPLPTHSTQLRDLPPPLRIHRRAQKERKDREMFPLVRLHRRKRPSYGRKERSSTLGSIKRSFLLLSLSLSLSLSFLPLFSPTVCGLFGLAAAKEKAKKEPGQRVSPKKDNYVIRCPFGHLISKTIVLYESSHTVSFLSTHCLCAA